MFRFVYAIKSRSDIASWIEDHTFQVMVALAQLYVFPVGNRVHWRKEVWDKFSEMHAFRHNKKLPDPGFIFRNSWGIDEQFAEDAIKFVIGKEEDYKPRENIDIEYYKQICEEYFKWLSEYLSKHRVLDLNDVRKELDKLGLRE